MAIQSLLGGADPFCLPNTGQGVENGDTWNAAITKINSNFSSGTVGAPPNTYYASKNGLAVNDVTDDTAALNALLSTVNTAGGGVIVMDGMALISGQITFPNDGQATLKQNSIRITGAGGNYYGQFIGAPSTSLCGLDLRYNAPVAKILTLGTGLLEIDHITLKNGGSDSAPFIKTTHTTLYIHDCAISGSGAGGTACVNDFVIFGGSGLIDSTTDSAFQGYGTSIFRNSFDKIRKGATFNGAANAIVFRENTVSLTCGDGTTKEITAATNANPAVLTSASHGFAVGDKIRLNISGATGNWAAINGSLVVITVINANTFSVPVNSTAFGALTGAPIYRDGAFLEFAGSTNYSTAGNYIAGNLIEMVNYAYFARLANSLENQFIMNNLFDAPAGLTVAYFKLISSAANGGMIFNGYVDGGIPILIGTARASVNVINGSGSAGSLDIQSQWLTDSNYLGLNTYKGGVTNGIRSDGTTQFTWSGPFNTDGGRNSTSTVSGDIVTAGGIGTGKDVTIGGVLAVKGLANFFGVAGSSTQILMPQTNGLNAIMNADGAALVFRNSGAGAMFYDSFGNGQFVFRISGGSTTVLDYNNANANAWTFGKPIKTAASATGACGFNIQTGTAPTSPADGDMWQDGANLKFRINGVTKTVTLT